MATQSSNGSKSSTAKAKPKRTARAPAAEKGQVQSAAEAAVDLPVGAALAVSDRVTDLVGPWTDRSSAEKQLRSYRTQVRKSLKRTERRGATARRRATTEARKTRKTVERKARKRQRSVEQRVRSAFDTPASHAQGLVEQVTDQLAALR